jgi:PKD repeat protein
MRSIRFLALATGALMLGSACGGDGGGVGPNEDPVADFSADPCTAGQPCAFTDNSSDDVGVTGWSWNFDDGTPVVQVKNPVHQFDNAGTYDVQLTVTDGGGKTNSKTIGVTVAPGTPGNNAPVAAFTYQCSSLECTFTNASTDADGDATITTYAWDFGDGTTSDLKDPAVKTYTATATTPFNVKLTVTDDAGASNSVTQIVTVTPPAAGQCDNGSGTLVSCGLDVTQKSHIKVTLLSNACTARGNALTISVPSQNFTQKIFSSGCTLTAPITFDVKGTNGTFDAGTELQVQMTSGSTDPDRVPPQLKITGDFPRWTLEFDDGEDPTKPGEPDFNDLVLQVDAEVRP